METKTVKELQTIANERGLQYSKLRKADIGLGKNENDLKLFSRHIKMETKTVKEMQTIAKERGLRGYSKLRKADLLAVLSKPADFGARADKQLSLAVPAVNALEGFDTWADEQFTKPSKHVKSNTWYEWLADHVPIPAGFNDWVDEQLAKPIKHAVSAASDWIMDKVPQPVKNVVDHGFYKLKNKINKLFNNSKNKPIIRESKSAIKGFAKQYVVDGIEGNDAATFLNNAKAEVVNLMGKNRQTKVNLVLSCEMERVDMKSGEVTNTVAPFVSKTVVVLEGTDVEGIFNEASHKFRNQWRNFK